MQLATFRNLAAEGRRAGRRPPAEAASQGSALVLRPDQEPTAAVPSTMPPGMLCTGPPLIGGLGRKLP
jgi:hypothetical protein